MRNRILTVLVSLVVGAIIGSALASATPNCGDSKNRTARDAVVIREGDCVNLSGHGAGVPNQFYRLRVVAPGTTDPNVTGEWFLTVDPTGDPIKVVLVTR